MDYFVRPCLLPSVIIVLSLLGALVFLCLKNTSNIGPNNTNGVRMQPNQLAIEALNFERERNWQRRRWFFSDAIVSVVLLIISKAHYHLSFHHLFCHHLSYHHLSYIRIRIHTLIIKLFIIFRQVIWTYWAKIARMQNSSLTTNPPLTGIES